MRFSALLSVTALGCALTLNPEGLPAGGSALPTLPEEPAAASTALASVEGQSSGVGAPLTRGRLWAGWNAFRGDAYALDAIERWLPEGQRLTCDREGLESYRGNVVRYAGPVLVNPAFRERLERFESVVAEVAREIYGREPVRIRHFGAFNCRPTRNRARLTSEHALGNALDVSGFDFGPATKAKPLAPGLARELRNSFQVRVGRHWAKTKGTAAVHARFLAELTERLRQRDDIFRSMFGPGHGGHDDHLHLDVSPWRYVDL